MAGLNLEIRMIFRKGFYTLCAAFEITEIEVECSVSAKDCSRQDQTL